MGYLDLMKKVHSGAGDEAVIGASHEGQTTNHPGFRVNHRSCLGLTGIAHRHPFQPVVLQRTVVRRNTRHKQHPSIVFLQTQLQPTPELYVVAVSGIPTAGDRERKNPVAPRDVHPEKGNSSPGSELEALR